ncbi:outer membrane protein [Aequorivita sublithincola DSM 14238]|uniref:Outer membrane protein n=1 Tax=Aequorivita sublithincola (strain DSM 14238 / LMG 21431 / ACAM 643 / 9-3) TaxID=746697 RepID=I3YVA6_AEQSU|nr:TolC family protein [Aequorivita sublithincola]AFL80924.1 outer membrane protein [Aequorivita sublithincola DSM 14238]
MTKNLLIFSFLLFSAMGFSQEKKAYSFNLEEAVTFALDSNYTSINARRDIAKAIKQKWETTAQGLPQIDGNISYNNNLKQPVSLIPAEFGGGEPGTFVPITFGTKQNANAVATLNQLIFDGSYLVGLKAAKAFLRFSENANEKTRLEVRKGVINGYGSVLLAQQLIDIFEKNKTNLEKNLYETRKIFENGLTEEESVEQLEITLLDVETQLNNARRSQAIAKQMFNLALGIDVETPVTLTDDLDKLTDANISLALLNDSLNVEKNVDYKIANNLVEQRYFENRLEKSKAFPRLSAFVNYGTSANSEDFTFFNGDQIWYQSSVFGVSLNVPIFSSGMRSAANQRTRIALDQAKTDLEQTEQQIKLDLTTAQSNYQFAIDNYENSKKNIALAERIENKNQIKFTEGLSTSFDLRQAQTQLYSAQQQYFQAMLQVINEKANLETVLNIPQLRITSEEIKGKF